MTQVGTLQNTFQIEKLAERIDVLTDFVCHQNKIISQLMYNPTTWTFPRNLGSGDQAVSASEGGGFPEFALHRSSQEQPRSCYLDNRPAEVSWLPMLSKFTIKDVVKIWNAEWTHNAVVHRPLKEIHRAPKNGFQRWGSRAILESVKRIKAVADLVQLLEMHQVEDPVNKLHRLTQVNSMTVNKTANMFCETLKQQGLTTPGHAPCMEKIFMSKLYKPGDTFWAELLT